VARSLPREGRGHHLLPLSLQANAARGATAPLGMGSLYPGRVLYRPLWQRASHHRVNVPDSVWVLCILDEFFTDPFGKEPPIIE